MNTKQTRQEETDVTKYRGEYKANPKTQLAAIDVREVVQRGVIKGIHGHALAVFQRQAVYYDSGFIRHMTAAAAATTTMTPNAVDTLLSEFGRGC